MRVLAIDPGLKRTGYACLGHEVGAPTQVLEAGCFAFDARKPVADRLVELDQDLRGLIDRTKPTHGAVERVFAHVERPGPAIVMGHARGVILLALRQCDIDIVELPPATVKKALTGSGRATKDQIGRAVAAALRLPAAPSPHDIADAMAIGIAAIARIETDVPALVTVRVGKAAASRRR
ncbi:MAG: crossover junction endodeoxyribonuclease RuvC [Phycisphaerales bacterium]|nr:crossover junction endodeoxyribonuclease RuvC [Phycisphaerales bacterium]